MATRRQVTTSSLANTRQHPSISEVIAGAVAAMRRRETEALKSQLIKLGSRASLESLLNKREASSD